MLRRVGIVFTAHCPSELKSGMKEVLTKSFWQGVKKTFYEALEDPPPIPRTGAFTGQMFSGKSGSA
jgi:hypothetical protein